MAIKPFEIQSPSLVLAGVQMQAGATGVVIPGVTQATSYSVEEVDDTGNQTQTWVSIPTVIDNGRYVILAGGPEPAGYAISEYTVEELDGSNYINEIQVDSAGSFPASYESTVTQNMWATTVADPFNNFDVNDWTQIQFAPRVRAGEIENVGGGANLGNLTIDGSTIESSDSAAYINFDAGDDENILALGTNDGAHVKISTDGGGTNFEFTAASGAGSITFPDGSVQTTAYTTAQQYGYFAEMSYGGERADGEAVAIDGDGNTYVGYCYYNNNDSTRYSGVAKFSSTGTKLWSQNIKSNTGNPEYSEITSLEYTTVNSTPYLVAIGTYYDNNTNLNNGFMWLINPDDGSVSTDFDTEVVGDGYGIQLQDAVFGTDSNGDTFTVMVGNSNNENLIKTFTPLAPSTTDKLYISWAEFNASGLANNTELTISTPSYAGAYMNAATALASPDGTGNGIYLTISSTQAGNYVITRVSGWSGVINGWSSPQAVRILGSNLGGTDGVNDLTFDFNPTIFADNSQNINAAVSNMAGTPVSNVYCQAYNGFDWSTLIGTATNFNQSVGDQGYIGRVGNTNSWSKSIGEGNYDKLMSVVVDSDENIYVAGYYYDNISRSAIVIKYDVTGAEQWAVYVDPDAHMNINQYSIDLLSDGNLITVGQDAVVTKIDKTDGSIIWQVDIDDYMSWDSQFRGTATPDGNYIFTNYEDNNYRMYVMCLSGTDGSVLWTKEIKDLLNGTNGEIYPLNQWQAQYIDCNATHVSIAATRYNNAASPNSVGLVINFPSNGDNSDGTYGQYIIGEYSFTWNTLSTTATTANVVSYSATETAGPASPTATSIDLDITSISIGGGAVTTPPTSIVNGTSWANIADADGNLVISVNNDNMSWTFASDRNIYGKANEDITIAVVDDNDDGYEVRQMVVDAIGGTTYARTGLDRSSYTIELNQNSQQWTFNGSNLQVNQDSNIYGYDYNVALVSMYSGSGNPAASLKSISHINDPNVFTSIDATSTGANIVTYNGGSQSSSANTWQFTTSGSFVLNNGGVIQDAAAVPAGYGFVMSAANLQTYTSTDATVGADYITTTGWQYTNFDNAEWYTQISQAGSAVGPYRSVPVTWGAGSTNPTGFVLVQFNGGNSFGICPATDGGGAPDPGTWKFPATIGSVSPAVAGGITLNANGYEWTFDTDGDLTLPGNLVAATASPAPSINGFDSINSVKVSATGNITGGNVVTGGVVSASGNVRGANFNTVGLVSATGNITGNYILGNGSQLTNLPSPTPTEDTGNNDAFVMVTSGALNYTGHVTIKPLSGDITTLGNIATGTLSASGNVTAGNISTSGSNGNITGANVITATTFSATGTASNLVRRANTIGAANTVVTLDNITAQLGGTPTRLYIGAASSNMTMAGTSQTLLSGSNQVASWINVPIVTGAGNAFAMSGAVSTNGDTVILNVTDQGAGSGTWRVTGMIANTSSNLYSVSIERLA